MKITFDTDKREVVCPQMFFDRHHELLEMNKVTQGKEISLEDYLTTLFNECKGNIKNASIYRKVYKKKD